MKKIVLVSMLALVGLVSVDMQGAAAAVKVDRRAYEKERMRLEVQGLEKLEELLLARQQAFIAEALGNLDSFVKEYRQSFMTPADKAFYADKLINKIDEKIQSLLSAKEKLKAIKQSDEKAY
jgi:hypothetical protein